MQENLDKPKIIKRDFEKWHDKKSELDQNEVRVNFHERDVWFSSVGANVGFEWDGKGKEFLRPIVILKKFNNETFWGIPLTDRFNL
jgi:mRNA interferase MazF